MKRFLTLSFSLITQLIVCSIYVSGQGLQKTYIGNGLYKVQSGDYYGICDENDNIKVSVEYNDIIFVGDTGLLTKTNGQVYGFVQTSGKVLYFDDDYEYNPQYAYYSEGYLPVKKSRKSSKERWMYLDMKGKPIVNSNTHSIPLILEKASAFSDGYAVVQVKKGVIHHIDKKGNERFKMENEDAVFRSSVRDGECVMISKSGIKVYQEDPSSKKAIVKMNLSPTCKEMQVSDINHMVSCSEGTLYMDHLGRPEKFVYTNGTETTLRKEQKAKESKDTGTETKKKTSLVKEVCDIENDIQITLSYSTISANEKGYASTTVYVKNTGKVQSGKLGITIETPNVATKFEECNLSRDARQSIRISIPARFIESERKQNMTITVSDGKNEIKKSFTLTIKRYDPGDLL